MSSDALLDEMGSRSTALTLWSATWPREAGVVRHAYRLNLPHQARQLVQVPVVNAYCGAQCLANAMQADGVVSPTLLKYDHCCATSSKKILGMATIR